MIFKLLIFYTYMLSSILLPISNLMALENEEEFSCQDIGAMESGEKCLFSECKDFISGLESASNNIFLSMAGQLCQMNLKENLPQNDSEMLEAKTVNMALADEILLFVRAILPLAEIEEKADLLCPSTVGLWNEINSLVPIFSNFIKDMILNDSRADDSDEVKIGGPVMGGGLGLLIIAGVVGVIALVLADQARPGYDVEPDSNQKKKQKLSNKFGVPALVIFVVGLLTFISAALVVGTARDEPDLETGGDKTPHINKMAILGSYFKQQIYQTFASILFIFSALKQMSSIEKASRHCYHGAALDMVLSQTYLGYGQNYLNNSIEMKKQVNANKDVVVLRKFFDDIENEDPTTKQTCFTKDAKIDKACACKESKTCITDQINTATSEILDNDDSFAPMLEVMPSLGSLFTSQTVPDPVEIREEGAAYKETLTSEWEALEENADNSAMFVLINDIRGTATYGDNLFEQLTNGETFSVDALGTVSEGLEGEEEVDPETIFVLNLIKELQ
jgi:hypothetical protein